MDDERWMREALAEARLAARGGGDPRGRRGGVAGARHRARAQPPAKALNDPTAHAEILALREAAQTRGGWRLLGATLYCTLEPCAMCAGALVNARVERLVFALRDPKAGAAGSVFDVVRSPWLNHRLQVTARGAGGTRRSG